LSDLVKKSKIEKLFSFSVSDWKNNREEILKTVMNYFPSSRVIVRSSAINEDSSDSSMAGCFESVLNVNSAESSEILKAIDRVIGSYKLKKMESSFNQVLIQAQTKGVVMSGVVFTRMLGTNAPYYVINYDDSSENTNTVTGGFENKMIEISRFAKLDNIPKDIYPIILAVKEIEGIIPEIGLDIEFAVNDKKEVILFQVRPIVSNSRKNFDEDVKKHLNKLKQRFIALSQKEDHLLGDSNIFADMPDWNPAEIIGHRPNLLDYTLYDYLITDSAWHEARTSQQYYNVNPAKLIVSFGSKPYVSVRNTFNSFTPKEISNELRGKLVNFYLDKLRKNPEMQDKVEFEILYTCYDLSFDERSKELLDYGFKKEEVRSLREALLNLTNNLILGSKKAFSEDASDLDRLKINREKLERNHVDQSVERKLEIAGALLSDCRKNGTVQFSRLARLAFIGKILLKSLMNLGIVSERFYNDFMNSINTIATELTEDFEQVCLGKETKEQFFKKYSHLRPGSYDITSLRYDSNPEILNMEFKLRETKPHSSFNLDDETENRINQALKTNGLNFDARELLDFIRIALELRESSKFEFTKNLSDALELIASAGEQMGFTREELAMLKIDEITTKYAKTKEELTSFWKKAIFERNKEIEIYNRIELPPIIFSEKDFDVIRYYSPRPNYITDKRISGKIAAVPRGKAENIDMENKIVIIENADPGYDWIFTKNPAGLITKYGGVASHMSIRCAEFGIPAAIGCGSLFDTLKNVGEIILDCKSKKIIVGGSSQNAGSNFPEKRKE